MWKPPEKIRYEPQPGTWPNASAAAASKLFSPVALGPAQLAHRTWVPAMVPWRASPEGEVTEEVIAWYSRFAEGRPGGLVVEATGIRDIPSGPLLRIGDNRFIPGLKRLVDAVRQASDGHTKLFIQLIDFLPIRRRPKPDMYFERYLKITDAHRAFVSMASAPEADVRARLATLTDEEMQKALKPREFEALRFGYRERVTDEHLPYIAELPEILPNLFAEAAVRASTAGFDGVELHYAHAYTMASFLSALNTRKDGYGGTRENRVRLPLEVFKAVREAVPTDMAVGCRFLSEDCVDGGSTLDDTCYFASEFANAGMDFLSLSRGGRFEDAKQPAVGQAAYPYTGPSGYECMPAYISDAKGPFGRNIEPAHQIRNAVRAAGHEAPVIVTGGIHGFQQAEEILQDGKADLVGLARQALADPDWFAKVFRGNGGAVRLCEYTNYCEGLDQKHKTVTCKLWDRLDLDEPGILKTQDGKRRLVAP